MEQAVNEAINDFQNKEIEEGADVSIKERRIMERRQDMFVKNISSEFKDIYVKIRLFFCTKLEKNWKRINEKLHS